MLPALAYRSVNVTDAVVRQHDVPYEDVTIPLVVVHNIRNTLTVIAVTGHVDSKPQVVRQRQDGVVWALALAIWGCVKSVLIAKILSRKGETNSLCTLGP